MTETQSIAESWLAEMEACVRAVDFARCRAIFAEDVVAFGSKASAVVGLDALERDQWRQVWPEIRSFTFQIDQLECSQGGDAMVWISCPWTSEGQDAGGNWAERPGRMTAVLVRRGGKWQAVHTHHSVAPAA